MKKHYQPNEEFKNEKQAIRKYFKEQGINIKLTQGKGTARMWLTITPTGQAKTDRSSEAFWNPDGSLTDLQIAQKRAASLLSGTGAITWLNPKKIDQMQASGNLKVIQLPPPARWELVKAIKQDEAPKPKPAEEQAVNILHKRMLATKKPAYDRDEVQKLIDRDPSIQPGEARLIHRLLAGPGHRLVGVEDRISKRNGKGRGLYL